MKFTNPEIEVVNFNSIDLVAGNIDAGSTTMGGGIGGEDD